MKCDVCGKVIEKSCYAGGNYCSSECFTAGYWLKRVNNKNCVIINGTCYFIGDEDSTDVFRGFDGKQFIIETNMNETIHTSNLWYNGKVPKAFRKLLPDNAEFVSI